MNKQRQLGEPTFGQQSRPHFALARIHWLEINLFPRSPPPQRCTAGEPLWQSRPHRKSELEIRLSDVAVGEVGEEHLVSPERSVKTPSPPHASMQLAKGPVSLRSGHDSMLASGSGNRKVLGWMYKPISIGDFSRQTRRSSGAMIWPRTYTQAGISPTRRILRR